MRPGLVGLASDFLLWLFPWLTGFLFCFPLRRSGQLELQHADGVAEIYFAPVVFPELQRIDRLDDLADEKRPAFRIERAVGAEEHVIRTEEIQAAAGRRFRAVHRGIGIEHPEVV